MFNCFFLLFSFHSLRGFLSIDIDVSGLYINQCDMNNQFYSESHNSNFRYNKITFNQHHPVQQPLMNPQLLTHQLVPIQSSSSYHIDNEIEAFHESHKCHRESMDVR